MANTVHKRLDLARLRNSQKHYKYRATGFVSPLDVLCAVLAKK
jgi:hypothetical protein